MKTVAIFIFDNVEVLDFAGPFEVFGVTGGRDNKRLYDVFTVAQFPRPVMARNNLSINPDFTFETMPDADVFVIPGGSGLRKLRWPLQGRGKRGGARVIYYRHVPAERIYLIYAYAKNEQADLTRDQIKALAQLMKDI